MAARDRKKGQRMREEEGREGRGGDAGTEES